MRPADRKLLAQIFWSFCKIGPITFGGGYASIPLIEREIVDRRGWVRREELGDVFAVSQTTPGAIAINSATFVGYRLAGWKGAFAATLGVLLPTFLIVLALSAAFFQIRDLPKVEAAFKGIRAAIVALIAYAAVKIGRNAVTDKMTLAAVAVTVAVLLVSHIHPVLIILGGALAGIVLVHVKERLGYASKTEREVVRYKYPDYFIGDGI